MAREHPLVLGIETSCDDTACAIVDGTGRVLSSVVSSQLEAHRPYGGVVPEIASREHLRNWPEVSRAALTASSVELTEIDALAATRGPGLVGCLLVGLSIGRAAAFALRRPFHAIHHLEGHLYSPFLRADGSPAEPLPERFLGLVISGGHTSLLEVEGERVLSLAETRDDAMGEVFDKIGKRLRLPYPQGPRVDTLAERGHVGTTRFSMPRVETELFFSFSGLKSQVLRAIEQRGYGDETEPEDPACELCDLLADFRAAAVRQILDRLTRLHARRPIGLLAVSGGVAANRLLRRELDRWAQAHGVELRLVPLVFAGDNAAMIAFAGLLRERRGLPGDPREAVVASRIPFEPSSAIISSS